MGEIWRTFILDTLDMRLCMNSDKLCST